MIIMALAVGVEDLAQGALGSKILDKIRAARVMPLTGGTAYRQRVLCIFRSHARCEVLENFEEILTI